MTTPDWDTYICKHCARLYGWLPAAKEYREGINKATLKYLTLCDIQAIDIFMLEKEGILTRDGNGRLPNVVICEQDADKIPEILKAVRPPIDEAIINGKLQELLTFEDDEFTLTTTPGTWVRNKEQRQRLKLKQKFERLRLYFPFDIINFDPCNSLLNLGINESRIYRALVRVFELQKTTVEFLLFLTTPLTEIHKSTERKFRDDFHNNISTFPAIKERLEASWGTTEYDKAEEMKRMALSIAKSLVIPAARQLGWLCDHKGIYIYENQARNRMLDSVIYCRQSSANEDDSRYLVDILNIISDMPKYYSFSWSSSNSDVKRHLESIVAFREQLRVSN